MAKWLDKFIDLLKTNMLFVSVIGIILGGVGTIITGGSLFFEEEVGGKEVFSAVKDVDVALFPAAILFLFVCVYYFYDYSKSLKLFEELLQTKSRAKFVRNQNELERLALKLGSKKEKEYFEAKRRLKIR